MKNIKQTITRFEKQLTNIKKQIRLHNKTLLDYAEILREYAQYLYSTQIIEHEIEALFLARKAIRCYGWLYRDDPKIYQSIYAKVLVEWFDYMNLGEDYAEGIRLAEKALAFYKPLLQKQKKQYLPAYAELLADYGYCLWKDEQTVKAQKILTDSLDIYKRLLKKDSALLLDYCHAQYCYAQSLQTTNKKQACEVVKASLTLLKQIENRQNVAITAQQVATREFYIELLEDDLVALAESEQLLVQYRWLISLNFKSYARRYARLLVRYADLSEANVWTDGYDGYYEDSPRLALTDELLAESVMVREKLIATGALYEDWGYLGTLKRYTEFLMEEDHQSRALSMAKKAMDFANKVFNKESRLIATRSMDELNYARICQLYAEVLGEQGQYHEAVKIALQGIFWYEQITLTDPYYLEELCTGLYEPDDYTNALQSAGNYLDNMGKTQQALIYLEKAYQLAKRRYDRYQTIYYLQRYLGIFNDYINLLNDNGHKQQALIYSDDLLEMAVHHFEIKKYRGVYPPLLVNAYGNNGYLLANNHCDEKALIQTKKALVCNGLVWYGDGVRYDKNKAWLLGNLGCYQNDLGDGERGLKNAKKSLAIRLRLFAENPLPFLLPLQSSYRNCADILKDLGHFEEALGYRKQLLALDKEYKFNSLWLDRLEIKWLNWLNCKKVKPFRVINVVDENLDNRDQQVLNFNQYWLLTCFTQSHDYLTRALYYLVHMDQDLQYDYLAELVILMSLLKERHWILPESLTITDDWQEDYQHYIAQRKGFVPRWMLRTAEKLNCTLPIITD